jgi:hypothetical protein
LSAHGIYQLTLMCDDASCAEVQVFTAPMRAIAKEEARALRWLIGKNNESYCPAHRERPRKRAA